MQECHRSHAFLESNLYLGKFGSVDCVFTHLPINYVTFHCLEANFTIVLCVHEKWDLNLHYRWLRLVSSTRALVITSSTTLGVFSLQLFLVIIIFSLVNLTHKSFVFRSHGPRWNLWNIKPFCVEYSFFWKPTCISLRKDNSFNPHEVLGY